MFERNMLNINVIGLVTLLTFIFSVPTVAQSLENEIKLGEQTWMTENLNVDKFRNGDPILEAKTDEEWQKAGKEGKPAWCYYSNNPANGKKYGKLYNWYAVNDPRGLAPKGWKIPKNQDWITFTEFEAFNALSIKSKTGWSENSPGNNSTGFSALPGGYRLEDGSFDGEGGYGGWWSNSEADVSRAINYFVSNDTGNWETEKANGLSVRCFKTDWPEWRPFGTYMWIRAREIERLDFNGRKIVKIEVELKQNIKTLDAENENFGDFRIVLAQTVSGPGAPAVDKFPNVGLEFNRKKEQIYKWPTPIYCFESQKDEYMSGNWNPDLGTVEYVPHTKPGDVYYGPLFLYKMCDDQSFKGQFMNCRGYEFIKVV
jgi:uncharacterized protein (TIGR02145 family)